MFWFSYFYAFRAVFASFLSFKLICNNASVFSKKFSLEENDRWFKEIIVTFTLINKLKSISLHCLCNLFQLEFIFNFVSSLMYLLFILF